jgi:hypothetical protein
MRHWDIIAVIGDGHTPVVSWPKRPSPQAVRHAMRRARKRYADVTSELYYRRMVTGRL